jgi:hypothetical protein
MAGHDMLRESEQARGSCWSHMARQVHAAAVSQVTRRVACCWHPCSDACCCGSWSGTLREPTATLCVANTEVLRSRMR